jgi:hypothetical protein
LFTLTHCYALCTYKNLHFLLQYLENKYLEGRYKIEKLPVQKPGRHAFVAGEYLLNCQAASVRELDKPLLQKMQPEQSRLVSDFLFHGISYQC